jgi:hypothetical protein
MKHSALLTGCYDWDPLQVPLTEFEARLAAVRHVLADRGSALLLVHGNSIEYGALAYLTGFVPKLGYAFALISKRGPVQLLVSGSTAMLPAARRLTWIEDLRLIGDLESAIQDLLRDEGLNGQAVLGLWGYRAMTHGTYMSISAAIQPFGRILELEESLDALRLQKSLLERELLRQAGRILAVASESLVRAAANGLGVRSAALAAERAAFDAGAQDARVLASARDGGPPLPLEGPRDRAVDPLLTCIAVRYTGVWAQGFVTAALRPSKALGRASEALAAMLQKARAGTTFSEISHLRTAHLHSYALHPLVERAVINGIGLTLEAWQDTRDSGTSSVSNSSIREGGIYTLCSGTLGEGGDNAIVSAMIAVDRAGIEVLWSAIGSQWVIPETLGSQ